MKIRILALSGMLALSCTGFGIATASAGSTAQADLPKDQVELIVDADEYMARINNTLAMALKGEYGPLRRGADARLRSARDDIAELLEGKATTTELQGDERVALVNAEEVFKAVIRNQDKGRMVCKLEAGTGSRLATRECMTVADREERSRRARLAAKELQQSKWDGFNQ